MPTYVVAAVSIVPDDGLVATENRGQLGRNRPPAAGLPAIDPADVEHLAGGVHHVVARLR